MRPWVRASLLAVILLGASLAYLPGLHGPFVLDDGQNITLNDSVALKTLDAASLREALAGTDSGLLRRPIPAFTFALNHYFAGGFESSFAFKATNLVIHLINTLLVWLLCLALLDTPAAKTIKPKQRAGVALIVTALWALHPIQLTNVLYVVQRMNSMATLSVFAGLLIYLHGRKRLPDQPEKALAIMLLGAAVGMLLGILCKENAVLWPLLALTIELTLLQSQRVARRARSMLIGFYTALLALILSAGAYVFLSQPDFVQQGYLGRSFSPFERLLTEARVLWYYVFSILIPDARHFGLFHDDIAVSTSLFKPIVTLPAVLSLIVLSACAIRYRRIYPVAAFALLWFLVGHSLESGVVGLELAYEHRNYLPSMGLLFGATVLAIQLGERQRKFRRGMAAFLIAAVLLCTAVTWSVSTAWRDAPTLAAESVRRHPDSARANDFAARVSLAENKDIVAALRYTLRGIDVAPHEAGFQIDLQILLASLAQEIEQRPDQAALRSSMPGNVLRVPGLETSFVIEREKKRLRLVHRTNPSLPELLAREPISAHTIFSIEQLTACVTAPASPCTRLHDDALAWLVVASENVNAARDYRAIVAADTAILYAHRGEYRSAYAYMTRASALLPKISTYEVLRTEYLIRLCAMDEAQTLIAALQTKHIDTRRLQELDTTVRAKTCRSGTRRSGT